MSQAQLKNSPAGWREWLFLPVYALRRLPMTLRLLMPFLRHPATALGNIRHLAVRDKDNFDGTCLGTASRNAFIQRIKNLKEAWLSGALAEKPEVWILQAYCQKPTDCACGPSPQSPHSKNGTQKRFNEFCVFAGKGPGPVCHEGTCRIGQVARIADIQGNGLIIRTKIMLDEHQMADLWSDMMAVQARTGTPILFVMDVCPFALWLAKCSLFRLKTPIGLVFFLQPETRCQNFSQYTEADAGGKKPLSPTSLSQTGFEEKTRILNQIIEIANSRNP